MGDSAQSFPRSCRVTPVMTDRGYMKRCIKLSSIF